MMMYITKDLVMPHALHRIAAEIAGAAVTNLTETVATDTAEVEQLPEQELTETAADTNQTEPTGNQTATGEAAREARRAYHREYRRKNREHILERERRWRAEHPEQVRERQRRFWARKAAEQTQCDGEGVTVL